LGKGLAVDLVKFSSGLGKELAVDWVSMIGKELR